ncbi:MAG: hypothetical protein R2695_06395 [Acidimicrobiales bacterium]
MERNHRADVGESEPDFEVAPHPGDGAPNIVVILLDDLGFSQFGCYGSDIDTPTSTPLPQAASASRTST